MKTKDENFKWTIINSYTSGINTNIKLVLVTYYRIIGMEKIFHRLLTLFNTLSKHFKYVKLLLQLLPTDITKSINIYTCTPVAIATTYDVGGNTNCYRRIYFYNYFLQWKHYLPR